MGEKGIVFNGSWASVETQENVSFEHVSENIKEFSYKMLPPFVLFSLFSHFFVHQNVSDTLSYICSLSQ